MNSETFTSVAGDIAALKTWLGGAVVTWNNSSYTAFKSRRTASDETVMGGFNDVYSGRVTLALRDFQQLVSGTWQIVRLPASGEKITVDGIEYRIASVAWDLASPVVTVELKQSDAPFK